MASYDVSSRVAAAMCSGARGSSLDQGMNHVHQAGLADTGFPRLPAPDARPSAEDILKASPTLKASPRQRRKSSKRPASAMPARQAEGTGHGWAAVS
jgi:hypothetical protein